MPDNLFIRIKDTAAYNLASADVCTMCRTLSGVTVFYEIIVRWIALLVLYKALFINSRARNYCGSPTSDERE